MYLKLTDFDHLRDDPTVRFREETVNGRDVIILAYMISNQELWDKPLGVECRGSTFDKETGDLISLPFEKFFNVNEKSHTQANIVSDYDVHCILDKRDGSMITAALVEGEVFLKTKKSFFSDVALDAQAHITENVRMLCRELLEAGFSPIFEFTSPDNKVVLSYGETPEFVLLACRDMVNGKYRSYATLEAYGLMYGVPVIEKTNLKSVAECLAAVETTEGVEGWVIYTDKGRFKVKTKWYVDRHHMIDIRERDIAGFVLDDTLDDLIPNLMAADADMEVVRRIESDVVARLSAGTELVAMLGGEAAKYEGAARAEWVAANAGILAKFVHRAARGIENKDESFREFFRQRFLSEYSLRSIGNPNFRGEDAE